MACFFAFEKKMSLLLGVKWRQLWHPDKGNHFSTEAQFKNLFVIQVSASLLFLLLSEILRGKLSQISLVLSSEKAQFFSPRSE